MVGMAQGVILASSILIAFFSCLVGHFLNSTALSTFLLLACATGVSWALLQRGTRSSDLETRRVRRIFWIGLFVRLGAMLLLHAYLVSVTSQIVIPGGDAQSYYTTGIDIASSIRNFTFSIPRAIEITRSTHYGYSLLSGVVYACFGSDVILMKLVNVFLGASMIWLTWLLGMEFFSASVARWGAWLVALNPAMILWSAVNLKDTFYAWLSVLLLLIATRLAKRFTIARVISFCLVFLIMVVTRSHLSLLLMVCVFLWWLIQALHAKQWHLIVVSVIVASVTGLFMLSVLRSGASWLQAFIRLDLVERFMQSARGLWQRYNMELYGISPASSFWRVLPLALGNMLIGPRLWAAKGLIEKLLVIDSLYRLILYPLGFFGFWSSLRRNWSRNLLLHGTLLAILIPVLVVALGGTYRWHLPMFPIIMLFAAYGAKNLNGRQPIYLLCLVCLAIGMFALFLWEMGGLLVSAIGTTAVLLALIVIIAIVWSKVATHHGNYL